MPQRAKKRLLAAAILLISLTSIPAALADEDKVHGKVEPVPAGYHTVTPYLMISGADKAIEFYQKAFGATVLKRYMALDGKRIMHSELKIGDSIIMISDDFSDQGLSKPKVGPQTQCYLHLYVPDVDAVWDRVVKAGAKIEFPLANQFWGDRYGTVVDPFGQGWSLASHVEDLSREEMDKRSAEFFKKMKSATDKSMQESEKKVPVPSQ